MATDRGTNMNASAPPAARLSDLSPDQFVDDTRAAELLSLSRSYMRALRVKGGGPRFSALSRKAIRYRVGDLLEWAASKAAGSTSEYEVGHVG